MSYAAPLKFDEIGFLLRVLAVYLPPWQATDQTHGIASAQYCSMGPLAVVLDFAIPHVSNSLEISFVETF